MIGGSVGCKGPTTKSQKSKLALKHKAWIKSGGMCYLCDLPMSYSGGWNIDHIIPKSLGGANTPSNMIAAHSHCNANKGNQLPPPGPVGSLALAYFHGKHGYYPVPMPPMSPQHAAAKGMPWPYPSDNKPSLPNHG